MGVYEGTQSLNYVDNYAHGTSQWEGFPITVDVTISDIMLGCKGSARSGDIMTLAGEAISQDLRGVMVRYCSVEGGLKYEESWDCSGSEESMEAYIQAMKELNDASTAAVVSAEEDDEDEETREGKKEKRKKRNARRSARAAARAIAKSASLA